MIYFYSSSEKYKHSSNFNVFRSFRTRQIEREEKILQNFLGRTEPPITEAFEIDGPYFVTTLALIIMKPADWEKHRLTFLQRLLLTAHIRSTNNPNDRTKYFFDHDKV